MALNHQQALAKLGTVQLNYEQLSDLRQQAIIDALNAGNSLREIAETAHCSHESVRRLAGETAAVFEWNGNTYAMTDDATRVLEYKADGFASGRFHNESFEQIAAGTSWQRDAVNLNRELGRSRRGEIKTISLDDGLARALFLILTATMTGRPNRLADLYDDLRGVYRTA